MPGRPFLCQRGNGRRMIALITGPSGIGKIDTCFALLKRFPYSVYLDSDWFFAKSPVDPLSVERIRELYELLVLNIGYHLNKGVETFLIGVYQQAAMHLHEYYDKMLGLRLPIVTVALVANQVELEKRILSRDRIETQKIAELAKVTAEIAQTQLLIQDGYFDLVVDTSRLSCDEVAGSIINNALRNRPKAGVGRGPDAQVQS
jgi:hypothetical protein